MQTAPRPTVQERTRQALCEAPTPSSPSQPTGGGTAPSLPRSTGRKRGTERFSDWARVTQRVQRGPGLRSWAVARRSPPLPERGAGLSSATAEGGRPPSARGGPQHPLQGQRLVPCSTEAWAHLRSPMASALEAGRAGPSSVPTTEPLVWGRGPLGIPGTENRRLTAGGACRQPEARPEFSGSPEALGQGGPGVALAWPAPGWGA